MNRRGFLAFLAATPLAGVVGMKPRLPTATAAMAPYLEARERRHRDWVKNEQTLVVHPKYHDDVKRLLAEQGKAAGESHKAMTTQRMAEIVSESTKKAFGDAWK